MTFRKALLLALHRLTELKKPKEFFLGTEEISGTENRQWTQKKQTDHSGRPGTIRKTRNSQERRIGKAVHSGRKRRKSIESFVKETVTDSFESTSKSIDSSSVHKSIDMNPSPAHHSISINSSPAYNTISINSSPAHHSISINSSPAYNTISINPSPAHHSISINSSPAYNTISINSSTAHHSIGINSSPAYNTISINSSHSYTAHAPQLCPH
ncbi:hypothetical protein XELAEV_18032584mg [Xenopus laevis]|uniref:Uncharacterized protein n=1 Tax=Xenopus laevis TaxID=8355 RepID=A0A974HD70_XENLA|nr:hypothetical protein XELAEV_18032584mg [Xenopus laevis]